MSHERVNTQPTFLLLTLLSTTPISHLTQTRTVVAPSYVVEILTALHKSITGIVNFVGGVCSWGALWRLRLPVCPLLRFLLCLWLLRVAELVLMRIISQFRKSFKRKNKLVFVLWIFSYSLPNIFLLLDRLSFHDHLPRPSYQPISKSSSSSNGRQTTPQKSPSASFSKLEFFSPLRKLTKSQRDCLWAIPCCFTVILPTLVLQNLRKHNSNTCHLFARRVYYVPPVLWSCYINAVPFFILQYYLSHLQIHNLVFKSYHRHRSIFPVLLFYGVSVEMVEGCWYHIWSTLWRWLCCPISYVWTTSASCCTWKSVRSTSTHSPARNEVIFAGRFSSP